MKDLAVLMSVYKNDRLDHLEESVQSVLNQTYNDFDYFISLDGPVSADINDYLSNLNDHRIKLFRIEKNSGLAQALNFLLNMALKNPDYQFIARMDADDISMPWRFEKQRNFLLANPDISIVGCWYEEIDGSGKHLFYRRLPTEHDALRKRYLTRTPFAHPSVIYKRELIEKAGYYPTDTVLMEDNVLWGRALKAGLLFANIPENLLKLRIDKWFFKRRSGTKYGWCFIITRLKINKSFNFPIAYSALSVLIGIIKMLPSFLLKYLYVLYRKY
jgi:glycosyltransferase involved in cell wall biosynthesis